ncbi:MAG: hypothetical protein UX04_C0002G0205 [Microgenomates group bacterium GW2011_GWF2_45_18]|nr:MAG: hypothetical protein UW18_C0003G0357 [Microgenomates group bacterium GW2011_GWF1_44_10]KKU02062.1 MAG: hypothetical protein UX04_C0002G0205 [Microgenomates group bacterium GW2011_GWF2_45_18]
MKAWSSDQLEQELGSLIKAETMFERCEALLVEAERSQSAIKVIFNAALEAVESYNNLKGING